MTLYPGADWVRARCASQGVSARALYAALDAIAQSGKDIHALLVVRHGRLILEQYFAPYDATTPHAMYSVSKTVTALMAGVAQQMGLIRLTDPVLPYFSDVPIERPNDFLRAMTIGDLLKMASGHITDPFPAMMADAEGDYARAFLNHPVDRAPGTHFVYNTGAAYMVAALLARVTQKDVLDLAEAWLFEPLGIHGARWLTCPRGVALGGTGLILRPLDMARLGLLMLGEGRFCGRQLVPAAYLRAASSRQIDNAGARTDPNWRAGYGYQLWQNAFGGYRADGMGGQYIVVMPEADMVVVFTAALGADIGYPLEVVRDVLLPGVGEGPMEEDDAAQAALDQLSGQLAAPEPVPMPEGAAAGVLWDTPIAFDEDNPMRLTAARVTPGLMHLTVDGRTLAIPFGWGTPEVGTAHAPLLREPPRAHPVCATGWWDGGLCIRWGYIGEPMSYRFRFTFGGDSAHLSARPTLTAPFEAVGRVAL